MTKQTKIIAGVLAGVAVGAAVGLLLYSDKCEGLKSRTTDLLSDLMNAGKDKLASIIDKVKDKPAESQT